MGDESKDDPVPEGKWRCPKCKELSSKRHSSCSECGAPKPEVKESLSKIIAAESSALLKASNPKEDPRLEAAKQKSRGTADAAKQALKALEERRRKETRAKEDMGMMRRQHLDGSARSSE